LQGTRTIIDNLESGKEVVPIITRYEGFTDCFHSIVTEEGVSGLFKGFGALILQYAVHLALLRLSCVSIREVLRLVNNPSEPLPQEYVDMNTPKVSSRADDKQQQQQQQESTPLVLNNEIVVQQSTNQQSPFQRVDDEAAPYKQH
jgi:hypothetical protein